MCDTPKCLAKLSTPQVPSASKHIHSLQHDPAHDHVLSLQPSAFSIQHDLAHDRDHVLVMTTNTNNEHVYNQHQPPNNQTSTQTTDGQENMNPHNTSMPRTRRRQAPPRRPNHDSIRHREWQRDPANTTTPVRKTQRATGTQTNSETRKQKQIRPQRTTYKRCETTLDANADPREQ